MMLSIIIPVYNEEETILGTVRKIQTVISQNNLVAEILVVDDGSQDRSPKMIAKLDGIVFLKNPYNLGYGASIKKGIKKAKGDWILIIDADGQHDPWDIPRLLKYTKDFDMVVGARTQGIFRQGIPRLCGKIILKLLTYLLTSQKIPDLNSGLRVFKKEIGLRFFNLLPARFSLTTTLSLAALTNEYTIKYIPIQIRPAQSKSAIKPLRDFSNFAALIVRIIVYFKPFRFFLGPSVLICTLGFIYMLYEIIVKQNIAESAVILLIGGLILGSIGLLADLIVRTRKNA